MHPPARNPGHRRITAAFSRTTMHSRAAYLFLRAPTARSRRPLRPRPLTCTRRIYSSYVYADALAALVLHRHRPPTVRVRSKGRVRRSSTADEQIATMCPPHTDDALLKRHDSGGARTDRRSLTTRR